MSNFTQTVDDCPEHESCEIIRYRDDTTGQQLWESHADNKTHVSCRIGDAAPQCVDARTGETHSWVEMCETCSAHFNTV